jgi:hypothetical protein
MLKNQDEETGIDDGKVGKVELSSEIEDDVDGDDIAEACSSHEFLFMKEGEMYEMKFIALLVQLFQFNLLLRIALTTSYDYSDQDWNIILGMVFAVLYYSMKIPESLSNGLRNEMHNSEIFAFLRDLLPKFKLRLVQGFLSGLFSCGFAFVFAFLFSFQCLGKFQIARLLGCCMELAILITSTVCVVFICNQQDNLLDILVNFAGIAIILELDEIAGNAFKSEFASKFRNKVEKKALEFHLLKPSVELGMMVWLGVLFTFVRVITFRHENTEEVI